MKTGLIGQVHQKTDKRPEFSVKYCLPVCLAGNSQNQGLQD